MDCMNFLFIPQGLDKARMEELFIAFYRAHFMRIKVLLGYAAMLWKSPDSWLRFIMNARNFFKFARSNDRLGK